MLETFLQNTTSLRFLDYENAHVKRFRDNADCHRANIFNCFFFFFISFLPQSLLLAVRISLPFSLFINKMTLKEGRLLERGGLLEEGR